MNLSIEQLKQDTHVGKHVRSNWDSGSRQCHKSGYLISSNLPLCQLSSRKRDRKDSWQADTYTSQICASRPPATGAAPSPPSEELLIFPHLLSLLKRCLSDQQRIMQSEKLTRESFLSRPSCSGWDKFHSVTTQPSFRSSLQIFLPSRISHSSNDLNLHFFIEVWWLIWS